MAQDENPIGRRKGSEIVYFAVLCALFAGLALLRPDLVAGAYKATLFSLTSGWGPAIKVISEILLFACIMVITLRTVPVGAEPARDGFIVLSASVYGYIAEAWGTRSGLWIYYTGEKPPLWIIPAWFIGALVIERLSRQTVKITSRLAENSLNDWLYRAWIFVFSCVFISFSAKSILTPAGILTTLLLAITLFSSRKQRRRDTAVLFTGMVCVFFADLWGTTNNCWIYHVQERAYGLAYGISFGAMFDSTVVLAGIKTAEAMLALVSRLKPVPHRD